MAASKTGNAGATATKKPNPALMKPLQPSTELAAVVGSSPLPRTEVVSKVWEYIKAHNLQNPQNKREILADEKLQAIFGARAR
jgi:chromatin remodeling complex protein RSC6